MAVRVWTPRCSPSGGTRKREKRTARFVTGNYNYEIGGMTDS